MAGKVAAAYRRDPRPFWISGVAGVLFPLYFPINFLTSPERAIPLDVAWDYAIPFVPEAVWVYSLVYLSAFFPALVVRSKTLFVNMAKAYAATLAIAYSVFLITPVTARAFRPAVDSFDTSTLSGWGLALNYHFDPPNNCFPSLHIGMAVVAAFSTLRADRLLGALALLTAFAIAVSTTLVKQHFLADVLGGLLLGAASSWVFLRREIPETAELERRYPRSVAALFLPFYGLFLGALLILYLGDWRPWLAA